MVRGRGRIRFSLFFIRFFRRRSIFLRFALGGTLLGGGFFRAFMIILVFCRGTSLALGA
jgi:uncharacterized protein involved in exopolysaccharide biosynthesis